MTDAEIQQAAARIKAWAASVQDARKTQHDATRAAQVRFAIPEPRPISRNQVEQGMAEFMAAQQTIPRVRLPPPPPPVIETVTAVLPAAPIPEPGGQKQVQGGLPSFEGIVCVDGVAYRAKFYGGLIGPV